MPKSSKHPKPVHKPFKSIAELAEYWEGHSPIDYDDSSRPDIHLEFDVKARRHWVALEPALSEQLAQYAHRQGVSTETLINLWLARQLQQVS